MNTTKLAMFYNSNFDTLICYTNHFSKDVKEVKNNNLYMFLNSSDNKLVSFNIADAQNELGFSFEGKSDIYSDNSRLLEKVIMLLSKYQVELSDIDHSFQYVVGYIEKCEKVEGSDKLSQCVVNVGSETLQIVCGAKNVAQGIKVVVAKIGTLMPNGLYIKESKLKGIDSMGMICSAKELGIENIYTNEGIIILNDSYKIGNSFWRELDINGR